MVAKNYLKAQKFSIGGISPLRKQLAYSPAALWLNRKPGLYLPTAQRRTKNTLEKKLGVKMNSHFRDLPVFSSLPDAELRPSW